MLNPVVAFRNWLGRRRLGRRPEEYSLRRKVTALSGQVKELTARQIMLMERLEGSTKNSYASHYAQAVGLTDRYYGRNDHGNELVKRCINLQAAFVVPSEIELQVPKQPGQDDPPEMEFVKKFVALNRLNLGVSYLLAIQAGQTGQLLLRLNASNDDESLAPTVEYIPWIPTMYRVQAAGESVLKGPYVATWTDSNGRAVRLEDDELAFVAFNPDLNDPERYVEGYPTLGTAINRLDQISKRMDGWDTSGQLFSQPTPFFKCASKSDADALMAMIEKKGWKVGTAIAANADFTMVSADLSAGQIMDLLMTTQVKLLSGSIGIAIHNLGWADVLSNRSTADSMGEPVEVASQADIGLWTAFYQDLFDKAIRMRNAKVGPGSKLREGVVKPNLLSKTDRQWAQVKDIWLPAAVANVIDQQMFLEQCPGVDVKAFLDRKTKETPPNEGQPENPLDGYPNYEQGGVGPTPGGSIPPATAGRVGG